jgi:hypothetical protein
LARLWLSQLRRAPSPLPDLVVPVGIFNPPDRNRE